MMGYTLDEIRRRIPKLPQWAQRYIHKLESDIEDLKKQRGEIAGEDALITWEMFSDDGVYGIPERARIIFQTEGGEIEATLRDGNLRICHAEIGRIATKPHAANVISVFCME